MHLHGSKGFISPFEQSCGCTSGVGKSLAVISDPDQTTVKYQSIPVGSRSHDNTHMRSIPYETSNQDLLQWLHFVCLNDDPSRLSKKQQHQHAGLGIAQSLDYEGARGRNAHFPLLFWLVCLNTNTFSPFLISGCSHKTRVINTTSTWSAGRTIELVSAQRALFIISPTPSLSILPTRTTRRSEICVALAPPPLPLHSRMVISPPFRSRQISLRTISTTCHEN
jgi:hypothetical protein